MTDPIALCAEGEGGLASASPDSLGSGWADDGRLARAADTVPTVSARAVTPDPGRHRAR